MKILFPSNHNRFNYFLSIFACLIGLYGNSIFGQQISATTSNGIFEVNWPLTNYYYSVETTADLGDSNSWKVLAKASPILTLNAEASLLVTNYNAENFYFSPPPTNSQQFYQLVEPKLVSVCNFEIFYDRELEFSDSSSLIINGPVYADGQIDLGTISGAVQIFSNTVVTTGGISYPLRDGIAYAPNSAVMNGQPPCVTNVVPLTPPWGTNNPHFIIEIPPLSELPNSNLGQQRLFNQAEVIIIVTNSPLGGNPAVSLTLQTVHNNTVPGNDPGNDPDKIHYYLTNVTTASLLNSANNATNVSMPFLNLTNTFSDQREYKTNIFVTQINIGAYASWLQTNPIVVGKIPGQQIYPIILYVADRRNIGTTKLSVVRLVNGTKLPYNNGLGFTVATQNPLYVMGNYNTTVDGTHFVTSMGQTTNGWSVPAALIADAITVLSANWTDNTSSNYVINSDLPSPTVIDAAVIAGNIPSTGTSTGTFSGGVHNLTRLLENWNGTTLTYNASIACLYASQMATNQFRNTGAANSYYSAPARYWAFDPTFSNPAQLPQGVPCYNAIP